MRELIAGSFLTLILFLSCGKLEGEFAVKKFEDVAYRRITRKLEVDKKTGLKWIFKFNSVSGHSRIGVILLKKEIAWVDIKKRSDYINKGKAIIYGEVKDLPVGKYKIVLTDIRRNNKKIAELVFEVYSDNGDEGDL